MLTRLLMAVVLLAGCRVGASGTGDGKVRQGDEASDGDPTGTDAGDGGGDGSTGSGSGDGATGDGGTGDGGGADGGTDDSGSTDGDIDIGDDTATPFVGEWRRVSTGYSHTCAIKNDRSVHCWGSNEYHQLEYPDLPMTSVSAGGAHSCGLLESGEVRCWGSSGGEEGVLTVPAGTFTSVYADWASTSVGVRPDGSLEFWGDADVYGYADPSGTFSKAKSDALYACGLDSAGTLTCWLTFSSIGEIEDLHADAVDEGPPDQRFLRFDNQNGMVCGVTTGGSVSCFGSHYQRAPDDWSRDHPGRIFRQVAMGQYHACALDIDGRLACYGDTARWGDALIDVPDATFRQISCGSFHTCGVTTDGDLLCWGHNPYGATDVPE